MDTPPTPPTPAQDDDPAPEGRSLRRAAELTAAVGLVHAVLFLLSIWLLHGVPGAGASDAELVAFYASSERRRVILVGLYLMPFAAIAFLWFAVALRMWISGSVRRENVLLSNVQLVSGIVFIALFLAGAAASSVLAASVEFAQSAIDPTMARQFPQYGSTLLLVLAMRMAAIFVFTTSNIGRISGILPRRFVFVGFAVGLVLLLSASLGPWLILAFPLWVLALCTLLYDRARRIPTAAAIPPRTAGWAGRRRGEEAVD